MPQGMALPGSPPLLDDMALEDGPAPELADTEGPTATDEDASALEAVAPPAPPAPLELLAPIVALPVALCPSSLPHAAPPNTSDSAATH